MNYIIHYTIEFQGKSFTSFTTIRGAKNPTDAAITIVQMVQATAPQSKITVTGTKETSEQDFERFIELVRL